MSQGINKIVNCKACGAIFKKQFREICPDCLDKENELVEMIENFVFGSTLSKVPMEDVLKEFSLSKKEFEDLYYNGRLTKAFEKLSIKCRSCGEELTKYTKNNFICDNCTLEMGKHMGDSKNRKLNTVKQILPNSVAKTLYGFNKD